MAKSSDFNPGGFSGHDDAHRTSDVDAAWFAQHHTLGPKSNQASPGNHDHDGITSKVVKARWTDYTPVWTASLTNPSLGNGSLIGKYSKFGYLTFFKIRLIFGSTTTPGTGSAYYFTLPDDGYSDFIALGQGTVYQWSSAAYYHYTAQMRNTGTPDQVENEVFLLTTTGSTLIKPGYPFVYANQDIISISGAYESVNP